MPRKRRAPRRRRELPHGLAEVSRAEQGQWRTYGPTIAGTPRAEGDLDAWPDWTTWATFYSTVRDQMFAARPWLRERAVCEALYRAWLEGRDDLDDLQAELSPDAPANDLRRLFPGGPS